MHVRPQRLISTFSRLTTLRHRLVTAHTRVLVRGPIYYAHRLLATLSTTAIHVPTESSARFESAKEQLRISLAELSRLNCTNQSRIQLALRGLEQDNAPVRIAVLGASVEMQGTRRESMRAPARFLRVLLADPLSPPQAWEDELVNWCGREEAQGLLLRYSPTHIPLTTTPNSPLTTLAFPSTFLQTYNLEILLTSLTPTQSSAEDIHVPSLIAPVPDSNYEVKKVPHRPTGMVMRYPVHKSIIFSNGLGELFATTGLISRLSEAKEGLDNFRSVAWVPGMNKDHLEANVRGNLQFLDLEAAENAFDHLRATRPNMQTFQKEYTASGLEKVQDWVKEGTQSPRPYTLPGATRSLISSILKPVAASLEKPTLMQSSTSVAESVSTSADDISNSFLSSPPSTTFSLPPSNIDNIESLTEAMRSFSTTSHQDLKTSLEEAFGSYPWTHKLAWYRLPFSLNNVGYHASCAISGKILPDTEHNAWIIAGRMWGAGFRNFTRETDSSSSVTTTTLGVGIKSKKQGKQEQKDPTLAEAEIARIIGAADSNSNSITHQQSSLSSPSSSRPTFPPIFPTAYHKITTTLLPPLHTSATNYLYTSTSLLLTSLFTTTLLYFSQVPLYTSFTASAVGAVISIKYLQRKWDLEKRRFEKEVWEVARRAVVDAERWGWGVLRRGVEVEVRVDGGSRGGQGGVIGGGRGERKKVAVEMGLGGLRDLGEEGR